jgi:Holliday junction DNA helicase RuvA
VDLAEAYDDRMRGGNNDHITSVKNDVMMALTALGYSSSDALKALSLVEITEDITEEELLEATLRKMNV